MRSDQPGIGTRMCRVFSEDGSKSLRSIYGSALSNAASKSVGGALGYQMFFGELRRRQLTLEIGGLTDTNNRGASAEAIGARWQQALGKRTILRLDAFGALQENAREAFGARMEFLVKF